MYILYADTLAELKEKSSLFSQYFEPLLLKLETYVSQNKPDLPEVAQYLQVCRWPFRQLEYSFVLSSLLKSLQPGSRYLDAGSGVTPLAHVLAELGVKAEACDGDSRVIEGLKELQPQQIYGSQVNYSVQNLTAANYPDATFDAISCVSVLEHIPAPYDQKAIKELLRILKPGGTLVITVDFTPSQANSIRRGQQSRLQYYSRRTMSLVRRGDLVEVLKGAQRKVVARQAVSQGLARNSRSANQCFEVSHLEQDILPILREVGAEVETDLAFSQSLNNITPELCRRFWAIDQDLFNNQGKRDVLPAAFIFRKTLA